MYKIFLVYYFVIIENLVNFVLNKRLCKNR